MWVACAPEVAETEGSFFGNETDVVENWVDVSAIATGATLESARRVRGELSLEPDAQLLGLIGNCDDAKNHELVTHALALVSRPVHLLHVGDVSRMPSAEVESWSQVPQRHTVHNLGDRDDIPALLAACDLVLVPSRREGFSLVAAEALCAGVPVIAADIAGLQWLSSISATALVPLDSGAWATAIEAGLIRDWAREVESSASAAKLRFDPRRGVSDYTSIYERVLLPRRSGRTRPEVRLDETRVARSD
jgi:glycosyltransferase EpsF